MFGMAEIKHVDKCVIESLGGGVDETVLVSEGVPHGFHLFCIGQHNNRSQLIDIFIIVIFINISIQYYTTFDLASIYHFFLRIVISPAKLNTCLFLNIYFILSMKKLVTNSSPMEK